MDGQDKQDRLDRLPSRAGKPKVRSSFPWLAWDQPPVMAEEVGFEPTTEGWTPSNRLAGGRTRPTMRLLQAMATQSGDLAEGVGFEPTRRSPT